MEVTYGEMVKMLAKSGADIIRNLDAEVAHILHMAIGISGEVAELIEAIHKSDIKHCIEELGDIEFYFEGLCQGMSVILNSRSSEDTFVAEKSITASPDATRDLFYCVVLAGDILDLSKKGAIYGDQSKLDSLVGPMSEFRSAIDDLYCYLALDRSDAIKSNMSKLSKRYKDFKFSNEAAKERADKQHGG